MRLEAAGTRPVVDVHLYIIPFETAILSDTNQITLKESNGQNARLSTKGVQEYGTKPLRQIKTGKGVHPSLPAMIRLLIWGLSGFTAADAERPALG